MPCAAPQKQKVETYLDENEDELLAYPAWVVSDDAGSLWKNGVVPPPAIQLSPVAAAEVLRLRKWATATVEQMQPQMPAVCPRPGQSQLLSSPGRQFRCVSRLKWCVRCIWGRRRCLILQCLLKCKRSRQQGNVQRRPLRCSER